MASSVSVPARAAAGSGRTLLFLHGIGGNRDSFAAQLAHFGARWRALAWDMPGYGASPAQTPLTFAALAESVAALLDAECARRAVLVGHSLGGMIAQETAARFPDRIMALVLFATSAAFGGRDGEFKRAFLAERLAPLERGQTPAQIAPGLIGAMLGAAAPRGARDAAIASMAAIAPAAYRAALECIVTFDRAADLARIDRPTLVLAAEHDRLAPPATMQRMAARIPGAAYRCLAGVGHLANLEAPAAFNAAIDEFLATLPTNGGR